MIMGTLFAARSRILRKICKADAYTTYESRPLLSLGEDLEFWFMMSTHSPRSDLDGGCRISNCQREFSTLRTTFYRVVPVHCIRRTATVSKLRSEFHRHRIMLASKRWVNGTDQWPSKRPADHWQSSCQAVTRWQICAVRRNALPHFVNETAENLQ
ncbi:hypothetical protein FA95DRAFT_1324835 [Auriscalpium vulgare]|uniref:Uncharacterized protein n=1 Tax=Auriscalpium vulgare TaxID=40419 RepID=A0ACB8S7I7_9AGAM|nr:hypothetical protein FA95DRAFT_1324835 [Auriscalpium vulgare]